VNMIIVHDLKT